MTRQADPQAGIAYGLQEVPGLVDLAFDPELVGLGAVVLDPDSAVSGEHPDILMNIVHLAGGLGDKLEAAALALE